MGISELSIAKDVFTVNRIYDGLNINATLAYFDWDYLCSKSSLGRIGKLYGLYLNAYAGSPQQFSIEFSEANIVNYLTLPGIGVYFFDFSGSPIVWGEDYLPILRNRGTSCSIQASSFVFFSEDQEA